MNAFNQSRTVEARGIAELLPFIEENAHLGRFVFTNKGPLSKRLQETIGDLLWHKDENRFYTVEIKVEERETGNFFLETWSNKNLDDRQNHFDIGSNPGWMLKCCAELLFYYFLDTKNLYIFDLYSLQRWAFGDSKGAGRLYVHREVPQGKYVQRNDTHGRLISLDTLRKDGVKLKRVNIQQLSLALEETAA